MEAYFKEGLQKLSLSLEEETIQVLFRYVKFLLEYNQHTNLTSIREEKAVIEKHILDSLLLEEFIPKDTKTAIDIGTGAGFPGMVLAICHPEIHFTLMDSVEKKTKFLEEVVNMFALKNVEVVNERAEEYILKGKREKYDVGFCRGVSKLAVILEYMIPFLNIGGLFLPQKMVGTDEKKEAENALKVLASGVKEESLRYLPHSKEGRLILQIEKRAKTNPKYPRKTGLVTKKPL